MQNYSSFSPNSLDGSEIELVAGDTMPELNITLRDSNTAASGQTLDPADPETWAVIDLTNVSAVRMYFRKVGETTLVDTITCTMVTPLTNGQIIMGWNPTTLAGLSGKYEGEIELTYSSGNIATVYDVLRFNIRTGF